VVAVSVVRTMAHLLFPVQHRFIQTCAVLPRS
jgi:hypothetical protein